MYNSTVWDAMEESDEVKDERETLGGGSDFKKQPQTSLFELTC